MRLHQREVALMVPDDSLLHIALAIKISDEKYVSFFIRNEYSHLKVCLRPIEPQVYTFSVGIFDSKCFFHFLSIVFLLVRSVKDLARLSLKNPLYVSVHENATHSTPDNLNQVILKYLYSNSGNICLHI